MIPFRKKSNQHKPDSQEYAALSANLEQAFDFEARPEYQAGLKTRMLDEVRQVPQIDLKQHRSNGGSAHGWQLVGGVVFAMTLLLTGLLWPSFSAPTRTIDNPVAPKTTTVRTFNGYRELSSLSNQAINPNPSAEKEEAEYLRHYQQVGKKSVDQPVIQSKLKDRSGPSIQPN
jgi:hypothetical protein